MGALQYIKRKQAIKQLGSQGIYDEKVKQIEDTILAMDDVSPILQREFVEDEIRNHKKAEERAFTMSIPGLFSAGLTGVMGYYLPQKGSELYPYLIAFAGITGICFADSIKSARKMKKVKENLKEHFALATEEDRRLGRVVTRKEALKKGYPFYTKISDATRETVLNDAVARFIDDYEMSIEFNA